MLKQTIRGDGSPVLTEYKPSFEAVNEKLSELTEEEIAQVSGGLALDYKLVAAPDIILMDSNS